MKKIKVAIVGVGSISKVHIEGYLNSGKAELYAFCDINEERLKYMGEQYGVTRLYTDEAEMLRELPEIEAVSVCTWNSAHAPCTIMALNAQNKQQPGVKRQDGAQRGQTGAERQEQA